MSTTVTIDIAGETFSAKGKVVTKIGWHSVYLDNSDDDKDGQDDEDQSLPKMKEGDDITCSQAVRRDAKTKPPARFTEGSLVNAMVNVHRFVPDSEHKKSFAKGTV